MPPKATKPKDKKGLIAPLGTKPREVKKPVMPAKASSTRGIHKGIATRKNKTNGR